MRTFLLPVLALIPAGGVAQAPRSSGEPDIGVTASHTIRIAADRATVYFLVEGTGESSDIAQQRAAQKLQSVRQAIQSSGLATIPAATVPYGVTPTPNTSGAPWPQGQISFTAKFAVRVQLARLDQVTVLASSAIAAGATSTSVPQFEFTGADTVRRNLFPTVLTMARHDAEALARGLNGTLGEVLHVATFGPTGQFPSPPYINFPSRFDSGGQASMPEVSITASVTVQYRFVPKP